jgi:hypothetical protein
MMIPITSLGNECHQGTRLACNITTSSTNRSRRFKNTRCKDAHLMVDKYGMGETVYRDKDGRKVDKPSRDKIREPPPMVELESGAQK